MYYLRLAFHALPEHTKHANNLLSSDLEVFTVAVYEILKVVSHVQMYNSNVVV